MTDSDCGVFRLKDLSKGALQEFSDSGQLALALINKAISQIVSRDRDSTPLICVLIGSVVTVVCHPSSQSD